MNGSNFIQSLESRTLFSTEPTVYSCEILGASKAISMEHENGNGAASPDGTNAGGSGGGSRIAGSARGRLLPTSELD